jgi:16S rRNA processing protein RimM
LPPAWERPERLIIGRVLSGHGVDGTLRIALLTHFPERLNLLRHVYLGDEEQPRRVRRARLQPPHGLLTLEGITTPEEAAQWRGQLVRIDHEQAAPLPPGEYYHWQIIGAAVVEEDGAALGIVAEIIETGANDVYVVRTPTGGEILLPAIAEVIRHVDTERGVITVHLLPGLVEP